MYMCFLACLHVWTPLDLCVGPTVLAMCASLCLSMNSLRQLEHLWRFSWTYLWTFWVWITNSLASIPWIKISRSESGLDKADPNPIHVWIGQSFQGSADPKLKFKNWKSGLDHPIQCQSGLIQCQSTLPIHPILICWSGPIQCQSDLRLGIKISQSKVGLINFLNHALYNMVSDPRYGLSLYPRFKKSMSMKMLIT